MFDSVPGAGIVDLDPPDGPTRAVRNRYEGVLERLATPYAIDGRGRASPSDHPTAPATPDAGVISTVLDLAEFTSGLQRGLLLRNGTLDDAWQAPVESDGDPLPHGLGWFVQTYNGETIAWQFGVSNNASSSLLVVVPERGISLVLLANSSGLTKSFELASGDLRSSPFGRLFLEMFVR
jgi:CubicO group peptidase (beta-lactamase class C family)